MNSYLSTIPEAIAEIKKGNMLIVLDTQREHEADFFIPTVKATPGHVLTMIRYGGGLICVAMAKEQARRLQLPLMIVPEKNQEKTKLNITVSVNARSGITTGISAFDRAKTIKILGNTESEPSDIVMPGHVFGLIAKDNGVLERGGHTETAVDLSKLAGFTPAGVLCEIIRDDGNMAELPDLVILAKKLNIKIITIRDLISYVKKNPLQQFEKKISIQKITGSKIPTQYGVFSFSVYRSLEDQREHVMLIKGMIKNPAMVRIHSQCVTGDVFGSMRCDCGMQLQKSMEIIGKNGNGILVYLNQEGRGIGLANKIKAYTLQDSGYDTVEANEQLGFPADARDYAVAAEMLQDVGVSHIRLLTNNPDKENQLAENGLKIVERISLEISPNEVNKKYLLTKKQKLHHKLRLV